jgi:hypothetical protein
MCHRLGKSRHRGGPGNGATGYLRNAGWREIEIAEEFQEATSSRRAMNDDDIAAMGENFAKQDATNQTIMRSCSREL